MRAEDHAQARRVDELELIEVEDDRGRVTDRVLVEFALEDRGAREVELPGELQHHSVSFAPNIHAQVLAS